MEVIEQQDYFRIAPVIRANSVAAPPSDGQMSAFEVPGEPFRRPLGKTFDVLGPVRNAVGVHKLALANQQRPLTQLDVLASDIKNMLDVFHSVLRLLEPPAQGASRYRRHMDNFETVIPGRWRGRRMFPPGAERTHAINVGSGIQEHHAWNLRK